MLNSYIYKEKTIDMAIKKAMSILNLNKDDIIYKVIHEKKGIIKKAEIEVYIIKDIMKMLKDKLHIIFNLMDLKAKINIKYENSIFYIDIESNDNNLLIGKNGATLKALNNIIYNLINKHIYVKVNIDVANYYKNQENMFVKNITKILKEVKKSNIEYKLDSMNSYQRRLVHKLVEKEKGLKSRSEGIEPNRYIIIERDDKANE